MKLTKTCYQKICVQRVVHTVVDVLQESYFKKMKVLSNTELCQKTKYLVPKRQPELFCVTD